MLLRESYLSSAGEAVCSIIRKTEGTILNLSWMTIPHKGLWRSLLMALSSPSTKAACRRRDKPNNVLREQVA